MSAVASRAVAPILKIRAALRERHGSSRFAAPNVVEVTDSLMLDWAEEEVRERRGVRGLLAAANEDLADLRRLVTSAFQPGAEREVSPLERLLLFTKIESAAGLVRQALNATALAALVALLWVTLPPATHRHDARVTRGRIVVRVRGGRVLESIEGPDGLAGGKDA